MKIRLLITLIALSGFVASCGILGSDDDNSTLQLSFSGLEPLQNGFHYEGWVIVGGNALTTGKFNVDNSGSIIDLEGNIISKGKFEQSSDISGATAFVLTIEPTGDTDDIPAPTHHLAGDFSDGESTLNFAHSASLGNDFTNASGTYILATPTDDDANNENSGIWFLDPSNGSPQAGLDLPTLPAGWMYEGWAVYNGIPISTGIFSSVNAADASATFSGMNAGPPFPGEDFLTNAPSGLSFPIDLAGGTAVISIEPYPDDSPAPFALKPLVGQIPAAATDHTPYTIANNASSFPTGTAIIK